MTFNTLIAHLSWDYQLDVLRHIHRHFDNDSSPSINRIPPGIWLYIGAVWCNDGDKWPRAHYQHSTHLW
jgi:hypothetical protein